MTARFIPSLFTILNLFCGFLSIINASEDRLEQAAMFIIYAALFDASDGILARFTGTSSKFGVELDSLCDVVSFGAAPSYLLYKFYFFQHQPLGIVLSSLIAIFAAIRLARFNANLVGFDKNYFSGLPVPLGAITISSFCLYYFNKNFGSGVSTVFIYALCFILPVLMVSKIKYDTTPKFSKKEIKNHPVKTIIVALVIILIAVTKGEGLFAFCLFYISTGLIRSWVNLFRKVVLKKSPVEGFSGKKIESKV